MEAPSPAHRHSGWNDEMGAISCGVAEGLTKQPNTTKQNKLNGRKRNRAECTSKANERRPKTS